MKKQLKYLFYATLLDAYQDYLSSDKIYQEYWGFSENPEFSEDEFHEKKRLELIDRINRVPFDSEKADRGTAFNEVIDCLILNRKSDKMKIDRICDPNDNTLVTNIRVIYNEHEFIFPIALCREFADYYKGAIPQVHVEAVLPTKYGNILLYGYVDELMSASVHDIKTTGKYSAGKFKNHWQHIVYPYCLCESGSQVRDFEYNIAALNQTKYELKYETFTEFYSYVPEVDNLRLTKHVEGLIEFIEAHRDLITDKKIFNQHE